MKVTVDRLHGTMSITVSETRPTRTISLGIDMTAELDRQGRLHRVELARPLDARVRKVLPWLASAFHVPELAGLDPALLLGGKSHRN